MAAPTVVVMSSYLLHAFVTIVNFPILSTAITEVISPYQLRRVLAARTLLGFGIGAAAVYSFGVMIDLATRLAPTVAWGVAFERLGLGGLAANYCAWQFGSLTR